MALTMPTGAPTLFIRREAYEKSGLTRQAIDERLGLTGDEFRVEGKLVALGPIYGEDGDALGAFISELEGLGLVYFDDFFELTGNWPDWLSLLATSASSFWPPPWSPISTMFLNPFTIICSATSSLSEAKTGPVIPIVPGNAAFALLTE